MLIKELCKRCHNNRLERWDESDERRWKEECVWCPFEYREEKEKYKNWRYIKEQPPTNCPLLLEHILTKED